MTKITRMISASIASICAPALFLCSCGDASSPGNAPAAEQSAETTPEIMTETTTTSSSSPVIDRAILSTGNNYRLKNKLEKLKNGGNVTFAYIGGSITEGIGAPAKDKCWAALSFSKIAGEYEDESHFINAGLSGTPSVLGNLRLERDVLSSSPDIVFVEFAVNDAQDETHRTAYESLVKTVLSQPGEPAVILVFFRTSSGYSCQQHMSEIGYNYDLPMISVNDAITAEFDSGSLKWEDFSSDEAHPNEYGHELASEMVKELFGRIENEDADEEYSLPDSVCFGTPFENALMITPAYNTDCEFINIEDTGCFSQSSNSGVNKFRESWHSDGSSDEPMKLTAKGNSFFVIYKRNKTGNMGSADVIVNGIKLKTINSHDKDGWGDPFCVQIIKFADIKDMEIEIKPASVGENKTFDILGFGITENAIE